MMEEVMYGAKEKGIIIGVATSWFVETKRTRVRACGKSKEEE
jgi:hypothetical protein